MSEYWLYLTSTSVVANVYSNLTHSYYEATSEKTTSQRVFYNKDKSLKVVLDLKNTAVVYTNLTMTQHVAPKTTAFGNYYEAIGLTTAQIKSKFGDPYTTTETSLVYLASSDNVKFVFMTMDTATDKCKNVSLYLKDNVEQSTVLDYYNASTPFTPKARLPTAANMRGLTEPLWPSRPWALSTIRQTKW